jgi:hypothetical protein
MGPQGARADAISRAELHAQTLPESAWKQTAFKSAKGFVTTFSEMYDKNPDNALKMIPASAVN